MCCKVFCISKWHTWHCEVWWKNHCINHFFFPFLCIQCGNDSYLMLDQYSIIDFHGVTNTFGLWVLHLQPHRFQGFRLDCFHSQTTVLCGIGQIVCCGGMGGRACLGLFLLVIKYIPTFSRCSWCHIYIDLTQHDHSM